MMQPQDAPKPKVSTLKVALIVGVTTVVTVGFLLYLMWESYADPHAVWQHLLWDLIKVLVPIWVIVSAILKLARKKPAP